MLYTYLIYTSFTPYSLSAFIIHASLFAKESIAMQINQAELYTCTHDSFYQENRKNYVYKKCFSNICNMRKMFRRFLKHIEFYVRPAKTRDFNKAE